ncbi:MAG: hypothetical protein M1838_000973 [Thelocarpon superellum]|nr:MAG: hypothetical protein M1838_000973 [Thelocarpon superellum]
MDSNAEAKASTSPPEAAITDPKKAELNGNVPYHESVADPPERPDEKEAANSDLEAGKAHSDSTLDEAPEPAADANIVGWNGEDDPHNPMNWSATARWGHVAIISGITFVTPLASSMFAPGVPELMAEFHSDSQTLAGFVVSVYILGFAIGPLVLAPLSELYGRLIIYHCCNVLFLIFTIACAVSSSLGMLIAFRFLAGCVGSAPLTIGGGTIADLIPQARRGAAMAIYAMGPLLGPVIGPVIGGFLTQAKGWRWVFWLLAIISGVIVISTLVFMRETYGVVLLERKTAALRKSTGNPALRSKFDKNISAKTLFWTAIVRPTKMLLFSPIVLLLSIYLAISYGYLYLLFTTFTIVFEDQYGFSSGTVGLSFLGIGVGCLLGLLFVGIVSDRIVKSKSAKGEMKPEYRLPPLIWAAPLLPVSLFWYGWSAEKHVHWIVPIIGTGLTGFSMIASWVCIIPLPILTPTTISSTLIFSLASFQMAILTYLIDAFTIYAASALAANTVLRSLCGAILPLAGQPMYSALGLGWGNSLLAFIALALCPVPVIFYRYGERIRKRSTVKF